MAAFVVRGNAFISFADYAALLLRTCDNLIDTLVDISHRNDFSVVARGQYRRFVKKIFYIRAGKARCKSCKSLEVNVRRKGFVSGVNLENLLSSADIGYLYVYLSVETTGTKKSGVENIGAVGGRHYDYTVVFLKTVHLNKQLIESLFPFVVSSAESRASLTSYRVDFVYKYDAGHVVFRLVEKVPDARRAYAYEHFYKV